MYNFKTLKCCSCGSTIVNLPESEVKKLNGLTFRCECCNHKNTLRGFHMEKCTDDDAFSSFKTFIPCET